MPRPKRLPKFKYTIRRGGKLVVKIPLPGLKYPVWRICRDETQEGVNRIIALIKSEHQKHVEESAIPETGGKFFDFWLALIKPRISAKTWTGYESKIRLYLKPALGELELAAIKPIHLQNLYQKLLDENLSAQTVKHLHSVAKNCFNEAVTQELLSKSPMRAVKPPRVVVSLQPKAMSLVEVKNFLSACETALHGTLFTFALETGMRPEEYLALSWKEVDLTKCTAAVIRACIEDKEHGFAFGPTKTKSSRRTVKFSATLRDRLLVHRTRQEEYLTEVRDRIRRRCKPSRLARRIANREVVTNHETYNLVFPSQNGTPIRSYNLNRRYFVEILKAAGIEGKFTPYSLRHTATSLLLMAGVSPKTVSAKMGHSSVFTTLNVYAHIIGGMEQDSLAKLENLLY